MLHTVPFLHGACVYMPAFRAGRVSIYVFLTWGGQELVGVAQIFSKVSRLYRCGPLQLKDHFAAFLKIYKIDVLLERSKLLICILFLHLASISQLR